jgi:hypothetical protein
MTNSTTFSGNLSCPISTVSNAMTLGTTKTFVVTMTNASGGNKYYIDGYLQASLELHQGQTYIFDLSSGTLSDHPFIFSESNSNDGTTNGTPYTTGITTTGTYGSTEKRTFIVPTGAPTTLYYYCTAHSGMGASASISPTAKLIVSGRVDSTDLVVTGTEGMTISVGTTAQRPSNPTTGMIRYNSTIGFMESYMGAGWGPIAQPPTVTGVSPITTLTSGGYAAGWYHQAELVHPTPTASDLFGGHDTTSESMECVSISSDGQYAIVGVKQDDEGSSDAGSAQVFKRTGRTWAWQAELRALGANEAGFSGVTSQGNWNFGWNVNISGDGVYAFVTQYQGQSGPSRSGSVHVFKRTDTTWTWKTELFNQNPEAYDRFGYNVDSNSDGSYLIVGAYRADPGSVASDAGSAQIFKRTNESWAHQAQLLHPTPAANDFFGWSVSISGDGTIAVVGVYQDDIGSDVNGNHGSAQVYLRNTSTDAWTWEDELLHPPSSGVSNGPGTYDYFGQSVAITSDGTRIIVGAYKAYDEAGSNAGAAFIFRRDTTASPIAWIHEAEIHHPTPDSSGVEDYFGFRVSISEDGVRVAVAAIQDNASVGGEGTIHIFKRTDTTWAHEKEITHPTPFVNARIGSGGLDMSTDGTHVIAGVPRETVGSYTYAGTVQIFDLRTLLLDSSTQVFTATGTGIVSGSTVQLEGADGSLYSVSNTTPNAAGTQVTFKMVNNNIMSPSEYDAVNTNSYSIYFAPNEINSVSGSSGYGQFYYNASSTWSDNPPYIALSMAQISSFGGGTPPNCPATQLWIDKDINGANTYKIVGIKTGVVGFAATDGFVVANQPYKIRVNAKSGLVATSTATIGFAVGWTSPAAGATLTFDTSASTTNTLAGTDGGGGTSRTFSVAPSSTALPGGLTLTGSTGVITGTIGAVGTTSVTFRLTDNGSGLFTDRAMNIVGTDELYPFTSPFTFTTGSARNPATPYSGGSLATYRDHSDYASAAWRTNTAYFKLGASTVDSAEDGFLLWTVPSNATYTIKAYGAAGGGQDKTPNNTFGNTNNNPTQGGYGAWTQGNFSLTKGEKILMIIGHIGRHRIEPGAANQATSSSGGGGGTYVLKELGASTAISNASIYCIAGGGGGGRDHDQNTSTGGPGIASQASEITSGGGGAISSLYGGGGGAGYFADGGIPTSTTASLTAQRPGIGSRGGWGSWQWGSTSYHGDKYGGFGGGGGNGAHDPGGGGGYTGGGGVANWSTPYGSIGGTSRNNGITGTITFGSGTYLQNGSVIITRN